MKELVASIAFAVLLFGGIIWWKVAQFRECRSVGLSRFYCAQHIAG